MQTQKGMKRILRQYWRKLKRISFPSIITVLKMKIHRTCFLMLKSSWNPWHCASSLSSISPRPFGHKETYKILQRIPFSWTDRIRSLWWLRHLWKGFSFSPPNPCWALSSRKSVYKEVGCFCGWSCHICPKQTFYCTHWKCSFFQRLCR